MTVEGDNWLAIFYGEGHMDTQLTNQIYTERYGQAGQTVGYVNTPTNPATTGNPAVPGNPNYDPNSQIQNANGTTQSDGDFWAGQNAGNQAPTSTPTIQPVPPNTTTPTNQPSTNPGSNTGNGQTPTNSSMSTADLLKEFLESDPDLMLNMVGNHFRAMGASNVFMQWFTNNFRSFWGRYLGMLAEQAYNGQVPNVSFVDWVMGMDPTGSFYQDGGPRTGSGTSSATFANFANAQGAQ